MLFFTKFDHIIQLHQSGNLPRFGLHYLMSQYLELAEGLNHETPPDDFSLEDHGYQMAILEAGTDARCVPIAGPVSKTIDLLQSQPEYVELVELADGVSLYRICFMQDNESFLLLYAEKGRMEPNVERWLAEQAGCSGEVDVQ